MSEYIEIAAQDVLLNNPVVFNNSIPCSRGNVYHENGTGIFTLRGNTPNCFARYQVTYNGNIAIPTGGTVGPIALAIAVSGEPRDSSKAIFTPAAVETFGNVSCTAIITVPRGLSTTISVRSVAGSTDPTATAAPVITVQNSNLVIDRIA